MKRSAGWLVHVLFMSLLISGCAGQAGSGSPRSPLPGVAAPAPNGYAPEAQFIAPPPGTNYTLLAPNLAVNPLGTAYYFVDAQSGATKVVNNSYSAVAPPTLTLSGATLAPYQGAFAFDRDGTLYGTAPLQADQSHNVLIINADSGEAAVSADLGITGQIFDLEMDAHGDALIASAHAIEMASAGSVRRFATAGYAAYRILSGVGGNVYVATNDGHILQFTSSLQLTRIISIAGAAPQISTLAPDPVDGIWIADPQVQRYWHLSSSGQLTQFVPTFVLSSIVTAHDGSVWLVGTNASSSNSAVAYVARDGSLTTYTLGSGYYAAFARGTFGWSSANSIFEIDSGGSIANVALTR